MHFAYYICKMHTVKCFQQKYIFCNEQDNKCTFHYLQDELEVKIRILTKQYSISIYR